MKTYPDLNRPNWLPLLIADFIVQAAMVAMLLA